MNIDDDDYNVPIPHEMIEMLFGFDCTVCSHGDKPNASSDNGGVIILVL